MSQPSPQGSPPGSLSALDWRSILWTLAVAALGAAATALVDGLLNSVLPELQNRGLIDGAMFVLLTTLLHAVRKFATDTRIFRVVLAMLVLVGASSSAMAEEVMVAIDNTKPGSYLITVDAAGNVTANPTRVVRPGQSPTPLPDPGPNPPQPAGLATLAQQLTAAALVEGGGHNTAASLSVAYSVVANQLDSGALPLAQVPGALKALSDGLIPANEAAIWAKWRIGIGDALTTRLGTKFDAVIALRHVSEGTKGAVNGSAAATGGKAIDWSALLQLLLPLLLKLLEKFLV